MLKKRILCLSFFAVLLFSCPGYSSTQAPITEENWSNHPKIVEIRTIYNEIEEAIKEKQLTKRTRARDEGPYAERALKAVFYDAAHMVRKYIEEHGSDDSLRRFSYYYDTKGALRFVFIEVGAVNNTASEHRIYLDVTGKKIWENQKTTQGPGNTFPKIWPEENLVFDPWEAFYFPQD